MITKFEKNKFSILAFIINIVVYFLLSREGYYDIKVLMIPFILDFTTTILITLSYSINQESELYVKYFIMILLSLIVPTCICTILILYNTVSLSSFGQATPSLIVLAIFQIYKNLFIVKGIIKIRSNYKRFRVLKELLFSAFKFFVSFFLSLFAMYQIYTRIRMFVIYSLLPLLFSLSLLFTFIFSIEFTAVYLIYYIIIRINKKYDFKFLRRASIIQNNNSIDLSTNSSNETKYILVKDFNAILKFVFVFLIFIAIIITKANIQDNKKIAEDSNTEITSVLNSTKIVNIHEAQLFDTIKFGKVYKRSKGIDFKSNSTDAYYTVIEKDENNKTMKLMSLFNMGTVMGKDIDDYYNSDFYHFLNYEFYPNAFSEIERLKIIQKQILVDDKLIPNTIDLPSFTDLKMLYTISKGINVSYKNKLAVMNPLLANPYYLENDTYYSTDKKDLLPKGSNKAWGRNFLLQPNPLKPGTCRYWDNNKQSTKFIAEVKTHDKLLFGYKLVLTIKYE